MAEDGVEYFKNLNSELSKLDTTITTKVVVNLDKIKAELREDMKREMAGRNSSGFGL